MNKTSGKYKIRKVPIFPSTSNSSKQESITYILKLLHKILIKFFHNR